MADKARDITDGILDEMERHLSAIYSRASAEIQKTAENYFAKFAKQDEAKRKLVEQGKLTEEEYIRWRKNKILYSKRFTELKENYAEQLLNVNKTALAYVNGKLPEVYSINYNALADTVDGVGGYSFTLVDANTVRHLATTDKSLLPYKVLDAAKDIPWNTKKINAEVLQGILQGDSINKIADRLMNVQEMNKTQAVRSARTIVTSAECKGRQDSYEKAKQDGMIIKKYWLATYDARARDWHREAGARYTPENGIDPDDFFIVDGEKMLYPGDGAHGASGHNLYNCRCSVASKVVGFRKVSQVEIPENEISSAIENISLDISDSHGTMKTGIQFFAKSSKDFETLVLPKQEYAHVMSEIATNLTKKQAAMQTFRKAIGNYVYTVENNGFGNYRIIGKMVIDPEIMDWWEE